MPEEPPIQRMFTAESADEMWDEVFYDCWFLTSISWKKGIVPEDPKDLDHVSVYVHVHFHLLVVNNSLLFLLLREYSRIRQPGVKMQIHQPWIHRIVWVIIEGHAKSRRFVNVRRREAEARGDANSVKKEVKIRRKLKAESAEHESMSDTDL